MASWHTSLFDDVNPSAHRKPSDGNGDIQGQDTSEASVTSPERQHIRLACQACQRKKIKCDRFFPCGQCTRSSLHCVPSTRKPRARQTGKRALDSELRNRISKLENLVESLSGDVATGTPQDGTPDQNEGADLDDDGAVAAAGKPQRQPSIAVEKYVGSQFWSSLTTEVQALRDALEEDQGEGEEDDTTPSTSTSGPSNATEYDLLLCPPGTVYVMPGALNEPSAELSSTLCVTFCENVDMLFKMFHTPSLQAFMIGGSSYLGQDHSAPGNKALKAAVWFSAVNTFPEDQCRSLLGLSRPDALQQFRRMVDLALAQADLINTSDIATLQALVTYLAAFRLTDPGRRMWTLMALAVRIAKAMGLHREGVPRSPYMTEIRRRLFHQVRFLDAYCCIDRGSEGLISPGSFDTPHPKNVNDSEFDVDSTEVPDHTHMLTDQSFALMAYSATERTHLLFIPEDKSGATWQERLHMAETFEKEIAAKYAGLCDPSKPYERMMQTVGETMIASMKLRAVRPVQKHVSSIPPRVDSPYVLNLALETLRCSERILTDPDTSKWRWMIWVPWHGLAVTLAGLCTIRDTPLAAQAWQAVEPSYTRNLRFVAEGRHGMLWRPIEKLYRKASAFRDHRENEPSPPRMTEQQALPEMGVTYPTTADNNKTLKPDLFPQYQQLQQPILNHNSLPHGSMPTSLPPTSMDFSDFELNPGNGNNNDDMAMLDLDSDLDLRNGDISWQDFERILEDMNNPASGEMLDSAGLGYGVQGLGNMGQGMSGVGQESGSVDPGDARWPLANMVQPGSWGGDL